MTTNFNTEGQLQPLVAKKKIFCLKCNFNIYIVE